MSYEALVLLATMDLYWEHYSSKETILELNALVMKLTPLATLTMNLYWEHYSSKETILELNALVMKLTPLATLTMDHYWEHYSSKETILELNALVTKLTPPATLSRAVWQQSSVSFSFATNVDDTTLSDNRHACGKAFYLIGDSDLGVSIILGELIYRLRMFHLAKHCLVNNDVRCI